MFFRLFKRLAYIRAMRMLAAILLLTLSTQLQAQRFVFLQWGTDDGLPASTINDITEDPLGFIWLATDGAGLVRFDGESFTQPVSPDSLPSPFVTVLEKDATGNFWIGTERGPAHYNGMQVNRFGELPQALRTRINAIYPVTTDSIWLATRNGLFLWNGRAFSQPISKLNQIEVFGIGPITEGLLAATAGGLFVIAGSVATPPPTTDLNLTDVQRLKPLTNATLAADAHGTYLVKTIADPILISDQADTRDALETKGGLFLASGTNGMSAHSVTQTTYINRNSGLAFDRVQCLYQSTNGNIWVGSLSGLSKLTTPNLRIFDKSQGLADERIHAIYTTKKGDTWVGNATGVSRYTNNFGAATHFTAANGLPEGLVLAIAEDETGTIWLGTEQGLARFNGSRFEPLALDDPFVFALKQKGKHLFVGTASGLYLVKNGKAHQVETNSQGFVQLVDYGDKLLGVGLGGKLFTVTENGVTPLDKLNNLQTDSLRISEVQNLADNRLALAIAGLGVFICDDENCRIIAESSGLNALSIKALSASPQRLWIGTDQGLYSVDLSDNENLIAERYSAESGFLANATNERSMLYNSRGELLIGTNAGLYVIDEDAFATPKPNRLFITGVDLFFNPYKQQTATDSLQAWSGIPQRLKLPFDQNYLTFHFASPDFSGNRVYWRYKLGGQDKDWTLAGNRPEAIFTNIPPGNYTFMVQRAHSPNFSDAAEASMKVAIIPPYYKRWWFITSLVLVVALITFLTVRYRINQLNARLQLETALAESERKALRLQMNPHFVFNALDAISGFIFKNEPKEAVRYLTSFAKLMRLTLESSREAKVPLQNELQLLKNYIELEQLRFNMAFTYTLDVADEIDPYEVSLPPMLLQPFVENAIIHGLRHRQEAGGKLNIGFQLKGERLEVTIEDNGVGRAKSAEINASRSKKSLATSITQERINLLSKTLGRPVTFEVKDLVDADGKPLGTRVRISMPHLAADEDA